MNGVLELGSNRYQVKAHNKAFDEYGFKIRVNEKYYNRVEGMKGSEILDRILQKNRISLPLALKQKLYARKKQIFQKIYKPHIPFNADVLLLKLKKNGYKLALATGSNKESTQRFVREYFRGIFDVVVTGDEVRKGKPSPEIYLKTLKELKLKADEYTVIENTPFGIISARGAGIPVIAIASTLPKNELKNATKILTSLKELNFLFG